MSEHEVDAAVHLLESSDDAFANADISLDQSD